VNPLDGSLSLSLGSRSFRFAARADDFGDDGLIEAAFGKKFAPRRYISFRRTLPALSMKLEPQKIDAKFGAVGGGRKAHASHCSR